MPSKFSQPSPSAGDADDERSNASAETTECDEPTMLTTNIYTQAAKEQSTEVIAIKTTHREMCRERITREIETLQRIQALLAEAEYAELRIHFPILLDFDSKPTSSGPRWLSTIPVRGFSLEQMTGIVMKTAVPSSGNTLACEIRFLAMPEALILHIAQQLVRSMSKASKALWRVHRLTRRLCGIPPWIRLLPTGIPLLRVRLWDSLISGDGWAWRLMGES
ncbi:hypothetical protein DDE83_001343 [Stemphylium lycopersici]|uniref:Uncharacterized protein n=1 Tax=Stemphylium lycopersici TaxID=183478 RepID=A0A364NDD5_STELY|nr:hypothetical protein DDE83_001343 [Stemphylium lycopersici]